MHIEIIGTGSAFAEGTNTSFIFWNNQGRGALIDCGSNVFEKLKEKKLISKIDTLFISHLHQDHSGSAETFLSYRFFVLGQKTDVIGAFDKFVMERLLGSTYTEVLIPEQERKISFEQVPVSHVSGMKCFGFLINDQVFYSGDSANSLLETPQARQAQMIIHDVSLRQNPVHVSLDELGKASSEIKSKTYLIHYLPEEKQTLLEKSLSLGFGGVLEAGENYSLSTARPLFQNFSKKLSRNF